MKKKIRIYSDYIILGIIMFPVVIRYDKMMSELILILKGQFFVLLVVLASFIIESFSEFKLLIWGFKYTKNEKLANAAANVNAFFYLIICFLTVLYDQYYQNNLDPGFSFLDWFILMIPFVLLFRKLYFRFQKIDPSLGDHEFID